MPSDEHDDLTSIKGIGPKGADALREILGVASFGDLAASSPEDVRRAHLSAGIPRPSEDVASVWIAEARQKAGGDARARAKPEPKVVSGDSQTTTAVHDWESYATFMVEFQTRDRVHRIVERQVVVREPETDIGESFSLEQGAEAFDWMRQQLASGHRLGDATPPASGPASSDEANESDAPESVWPGVRIDHVELYQPPKSQIPLARADEDHPNLGVARVKEPVVLRIEFVRDSLEGTDDSDADVTYVGEIYIQAWDSGAAVHIGPTAPAPLVADTERYAVEIRHAFDAPGLYRAQCVITLSTEPPTSELLEIPLLQVH